MRRSVPTATAALTLALVATASACGGGAAEQASGPRSIEDLFDPADMAARETKVQAAVAECMKSRGWDYVPLDPSALSFGVTIGGPASPEDRATKGYGISTGMLQETAQATTGEDPNAEYQASLSESDRQAYQRDLFGELPEAAEGEGGTFVVALGGEDGEDPLAGNTGCFAEAQRSVTDVGPDLSELGPELTELEDQISADPRMIEATQDWAACMDSSGFDFADPDEIFSYLFAKMGSLPTPADGGDGGDAGSTAGDGQVGIVLGGAGLDEAELSALQSEEIAIAVADGQCADSTGFAKVREEVRAAYEQRFFDEHPELG